MNARRLTWQWRVILAVARVLRVILRLRIDMRGISHVPVAGGAVLAFNHHSAIDFVALGWAVVRAHRRPVRFLGKRELWDSRKYGWAARAVDAIPVDRASATDRADALGAAVQALADGDLVAVAPEQTVSNSFELLPFRTGAARMAQAAGVPIVPVVGWGTQRLAPYGRGFRPRLGVPVVVAFGEPIAVGPDDDVVAVTERLRERMQESLHAIQETYADGAPAGAWWVPARLGGGAPPHGEVLDEHTERIRRWRQRHPRRDGGGRS